MIQPLKSFFLFLMVLAFLALLQLLPDEVVLFADQKLKIPKLSSFFQSQESQYADISKLTKEFEVKEKKGDQEEEKNKKGSGKVYVPDSLKLNEELRIQYAQGKDSSLFAFFRALKSLENHNEHIRVLHYGDSQLEGDRITAFLREKFQQEFGGCGVGVAGIVDKLHTKTSIFQIADPQWTQYAIFGGNYRANFPNFYGILGDYYKFPVGKNNQEKNIIKKTALQDPPPVQKWTKASVSYLRSPQATYRQSLVENVKIMFRNPEAPFELRVQAGADTSFQVKFLENSDFNYFEYKLKTNFERINIAFASESKSPEVYGVALDCNKGITFDNVPLRGSSGVEFTRINKKHLKQQFEKLNVRFLILQFGVNIVPYVLEDYSFYENQFYEQLKFLKSLSPELSILVVGVSDMSRAGAKGYETYPNIEKIRDAQKRASFRAGCAFWDLYEAMGGKNSMPSWVFANPALATKDFTHFTAKGAQLVSEMLYKAILTEYDRFNKIYY